MGKREPSFATDLERELYKALQQCLGLLCEAGDLNNYRNLSDAELGRAWTATARNAGNLLNRIDGLPHDPRPLRRPMMSERRNSDALSDRLYEAAVRAIAANNIGVVGKDGRARIVVEWIDAQGKLATLLREIGGEIPMHTETCAARKSPLALCDCETFHEAKAPPND